VGPDSAVIHSSTVPFCFRKLDPHESARARFEMQLIFLHPLFLASNFLRTESRMNSRCNSDLKAIGGSGYLIPKFAVLSFWTVLMG
jgi:hypothetical protein